MLVAGTLSLRTGKSTSMRRICLRTYTNRYTQVHLKLHQDGLRRQLKPQASIECHPRSQRCQHLAVRPVILLKQLELELSSRLLQLIRPISDD